MGKLAFVPVICFLVGVEFAKANNDNTSKKEQIKISLIYTLIATVLIYVLVGILSLIF